MCDQMKIYLAGPLFCAARALPATQRNSRINRRGAEAAERRTCQKNKLLQLSNVGERRFNGQLAAALGRLCPNAEVLLPQDQARTIQGSSDFLSRMYAFCLESIDSCDAMVAILDGPDADSGTCIEIGYALARGKPVVGVRSDFRTGEDRGLNLMVAGSCTRLICAPQLESIEQLAQDIADAIASVVNQ